VMVLRVSSQAECSVSSVQCAGRCKASWKRGFKLPWREAGPPSHHDKKVDSDK